MPRYWAEIGTESVMAPEAETDPNQLGFRVQGLNCGLRV
jgi:hypothetical protein